MLSFVGSMGSSQILSCALCIFVGLIKEASGQDGHLQCPNLWISGHDVTLSCAVSKTSIARECSPQPKIANFFKGGALECRIEGERYQNCGNYTGTLDAPCWCEQNNTYYIFKYKFTAREHQEGAWTCEQDCSGLVNTLVITADPACNASVKASDCENKKCMEPGVCDLDTKENKGQCVCPHDYAETDCGPCRDMDKRKGCKKWDIATLTFVFVLLVLAGVFCWWATTRLIICVIVLREMTPEEKRIVADFVNSPSNPLGEIIEAPLSSCSCCCKAEVTVIGKGINDDLNEIGPPRVIVKGKRICYDALKSRGEEVRDRIEAELDNRRLAPPNEPFADYPLRSLKPDGSSGHATNGSNVVTPL